MRKSQPNQTDEISKIKGQSFVAEYAQSILYTIRDNVLLPVEELSFNKESNPS